MFDFSTPLAHVRERAPLVQCITNFVTVNDCANIILASGGSPTMAHDLREAADVAVSAQALVCNMGAIENIDAMRLAGQRANQAGIPVVLDPVAAGATRLRQEAARQLLSAAHFTAIRGNASEIRFLDGQGASGSGVDAAPSDVISPDNLSTALDIVSRLARQTGSIIVLSGPLDVISDSRQVMVLHNGCPTMSRITGSGCMLTALIGAFCGATPETPFAAVCSAVAAMGVYGELAEARRLKNGTGNATFRTDLIDAVFNLTENQLMESVQYEIYER